MKRWVWILLILWAVYLAILFSPAAAKKLKEQTIKQVASQWLEPVRQMLSRQYTYSYEELWTAWVLSMIAQESGGHADAYNRKDPSWGLMGITQDVLTEFNNVNGKSYTIEDLKNPLINLEVGTWYWHFLWKSYNEDYEKAVMAYNAGQGNLEAGRPHLERVKEFLLLICSTNSMRCV